MSLGAQLFDILLSFVRTSLAACALDMIMVYCQTGFLQERRHTSVPAVPTINLLCSKCSMRIAPEAIPLRLRALLVSGHHGRGPPMNKSMLPVRNPDVAVGA